MTESDAKRQRILRLAALMTLVLLAVASSITNLHNTFVQDDLPIIKGNALVHSLRVWHLFTQAYWPFPYPRDLYRPLTSTLLALEWVTGGGRPIVFRVVSILLYTGSVLALFRLARRVVDPGVAWLAAALFAVHPVHVEAVAVGVNQAEIAVGAILALLMTAYIDRRRSAQPITLGWMVAMASGYVVASLFKEHGLLLPALMVAAELTVIEDRRPWRERITALRPFYLLLILAAVCLIGVRTLALGGDTKGSFTAEALSGLGIGGRLLTMLSVVPEWVRLFLWPNHLRADYSPQEIVSAVRWGNDQTMGVALIALVGWFAWVARRARAQITFGILWMAIGLALVSNVIIAAGITLAERTLFLASMGVMIVVSDLFSLAIERLARRGTVTKLAGCALIALVIGLGVARSASRQRVWRDLSTLWYQTVIDAPKSYRAQQAYGSVLFEVGMQHSAEEHYRRAMRLYPDAWPLYLDFADKLRVAGRCEPAVHYYQLVLVLTPAQSGPRGSEVACLIYMGEYTRAAREARLGAGYGIQPASFAIYAAIADSAARVHAPPHSVNLPPPVDSLSAP